MYTTFTSPVKSTNPQTLSSQTTRRTRQTLTNKPQSHKKYNQFVTKPRSEDALSWGRIFPYPMDTSVSFYTAMTPPSTPFPPLLPRSKPDVHAGKKRAPRNQGNGQHASQAPSGPTPSRRKPPQRQKQSNNASPQSLTPMARRTS